MVPVSQSASALESPRDAPPAVRWRSWPLRDRPLRGALVLLGLIAVGLLVHGLTGRPHLAFLAVGALVVALWRLFVPMTIEMNDQGVDRWILGRKRHIPWQAIRRHRVGPDGVLLLPDDDPSPLAALRGLYLPWGRHREEVLAHLRHYLPGRRP